MEQLAKKEGGRRTLPLETWKADGEKRFGADVKDWVFVCAGCGEKQTLAEFIAAGVESPDTKFFFSCIGRWVEGRGCNWTLGGLFQIHKTEVIGEGGKPVPVFEFADEEGA